MKREAVVRLIQTAESDPGRFDELLAALKRREAASQARRHRLGEDFHRAVVYSVIAFTGVRYLDRSTRAFLRPTARSVLMGAGLVAFYILEVALLLAIAGAVGLDPVYAVIGVILAMLLQLGWIITRGLRWIQRGAGDKLGMSLACVGCGYALGGLESALGEAVWVGPQRCPECGLAYPAVG